MVRRVSRPAAAHSSYNCLDDDDDENDGDDVDDDDDDDDDDGDDEDDVSRLAAAHSSYNCFAFSSSSAAFSSSRILIHSPSYPSHYHFQ